jgi:signal transduction histidine kinase
MDCRSGMNPPGADGNLDDPRRRERRVLLLPPTARDGELIRAILTEAGLDWTACADLEELCGELEHGAGCALIAENVLGAQGLDRLAAARRFQPAWFDLPLIVLTRGGAAESPGLGAQVEALGNMIRLEMPVRIQTLLSVLRSALQGRARQYQLRDQMAVEQQYRDDLREANEQLSESDRRKDEFLAMLAHELRNPLAPIAFAAQLLKTGNLPDAQVNLQHEVIERQIRHMARLLDDLLEVSRITRGKIALRREVVDLRAIAAQAVDSQRALAESRGQDLLLENHGAPLPVHGDATRLDQVFRNLLHNASKFTGLGGHIIVSLRLEGQRDDEPWAVVLVRDSGIGISAEMLPRVFELFSQADQSLARQDGGLGIGLAMVKNLIEMHGGSVEAHSAGRDQGSEFVVRLPLAATGTNAPSGPPSAAMNDETPAKPLRVLIVDDNEDSATVLGHLLKLWGHDVRTARDGRDALAAAHRWQPDVVLLDIGLPEMDGYEIARRLRADPGMAGAFLVAVTGYGQDEDRRRAREAGFDEHVVKPVDLARLQVVLQRAG